MTDGPSRREIKRTVAKGVAELRNRPGWNPLAPSHPSAEDKLTALDQKMRTGAAYERAEACAACVEEREESGDETALCEEHLMAAMGLV